jgi:RimJ/RimL family protein N-acetyltransferase
VTDVVRLRKATFADADLLLGWANDPVTRAAGFRPDWIEPAEHRVWLASRLAAPDRPLLVAVLGDQPIGVVRLDPVGRGEVEVGIALAQEFRGRGLAAEVLSAGLEWADRNPNIRATTYLARVRPTNVPSLALFRQLGFLEREQTSVDGVPCIVFARSSAAPERS